ncbi:MAG: glycogen debranching enzyme family protein [Phycisphaeraceae bacterium]|nr:glycogen debranching enzyme family protein [Phycisphaeraceae bacterium]
MDLDWRTHAIDFDGFAEQRVNQEWLLTNGSGAFAASTAPGINTRRYHGLLIAACKPPVDRVVVLNQIWDQLVIHRPHDAGEPTDLSQPIDLASLMFRSGPGGRDTVFAPIGCHMLQRFERGLSVRWTFHWGTIEIQRELFLHWKKQAITLRYQLRGLETLKARATMRLSPMLTLRDFHAVCGQHWGEPGITVEGDTLRARRGDLIVTCHLPGSSFEPNAHWWQHVFYPVDAERGQECSEDYFVPGAMVVDVPANGEILFTAALGDKAAKPQPDTTARAKHLAPVRSKLAGQHAATFAVACDDFVVDRTVNKRKLSTILAGYPWFADWGRDTFIALPGLLLCTGRHAEAKRVLQTFAAHLRDGVIPNRFHDQVSADEAATSTGADYNTVDASLWFVYAAFEYLRVTRDDVAWKSFLRKAVIHIVESYLNGAWTDDKTRIHSDDDGLIVAGHARSQLTWMDAACGGVVFTPRFGKAVEINALWYHSLMCLIQRESKQKRYEQLAQRVRDSFEATFWNQHAGGLYDHVYLDEQNELRRDASVRPNQVFAVSLPHSPLSKPKQQAVVELLRNKLLVPMGLRTLPPDDAHYHPRYTGNAYQRDEAYHQGTVWPWLIGPYAEATLRAYDFCQEARQRAARAIAPLIEQLTASDPRPCSFGQLHEVFEAEPADAARPVGCFAQAWSVAELLRAMCLVES